MNPQQKRHIRNKNVVLPFMSLFLIIILFFDVSGGQNTQNIVNLNWNVSFNLNSGLKNWNDAARITLYFNNTHTVVMYGKNDWNNLYLGFLISDALLGTQSTEKNTFRLYFDSNKDEYWPEDIKIVSFRSNLTSISKKDGYFVSGSSTIYVDPKSTADFSVSIKNVSITSTDYRILIQFVIPLMTDEPQYDMQIFSAPDTIIGINFDYITSDGKLYTLYPYNNTDVGVNAQNYVTVVLAEPSDIAAPQYEATELPPEESGQSGASNVLRGSYGGEAASWGFELVSVLIGLSFVVVFIHVQKMRNGGRKNGE